MLLLFSCKLIFIAIIIHFEKAVRALWASKSIHRLLWLYSYCKATLTVWGSENDQLSSNESILLFRKYFRKSSTFYDLPEKQHHFFHLYAHDPNEMEKILAKSNDLLVKYCLKNTVILSDYWRTLHGNIMQTTHSALMFNLGASYISTKQYKAKDNVKIYELHGKFELFSTAKVHEKGLNDSQYALNSANTNNSDANVANDNNIAVDAVNTENQLTGCIRISLRTSSKILIDDILESNFENHSAGSINIYLFTNGLVKIFVGTKLQQEANFPASNVFEYVKDLFETQKV